MGGDHILAEKNFVIDNNAEENVFSKKMQKKRRSGHSVLKMGIVACIR